MNDARPVLEMSGVSFSYMATRPLLRSIDLDARPGEVAMILGMSGSGKTTLLKLCKGLLAPRSGTIRAFGEPVRPAVGRGTLDPRVAYIPQQLGLVRSLSALDNVLTGALARTRGVATLRGSFPSAARREASALLERLGIASKSDDQVYSLSGGERQRVAIARSLMQWPKVLLADEFISDLDPVTGEEIMRVVRDIADEGVAVVMTTHELDVVRAYAEHVVVLRDGVKALDVRERPDVDRIVAAFR